MKLYKCIKGWVITACLLLLTAMPTVAQNSAHQHSDHGAPALTLNNGQKWQSDGPLRQGMEKINNAVIKAVPAFHQDTLTKFDAEQLANEINQQVEYLVQNCKLSPQADAVLHVIIADLVAGANVLTTHPLSMQGLPRIVGALQQYPKYFEQPQWHEISH